MDKKKLLCVLISLTVLLIIVWLVQTFLRSEILGSFLRECYQMSRFMLKIP